MNAALRHLSPTAEFTLVFCLCFGMQMAFTVRAVVARSKGTAPRPSRLSNATMRRILTTELIALPAALWILSVRGWSPATLGLHISGMRFWNESMAGILLFAALMAGSSLFGLLLKSLNIEPPAKFLSVDAGLAWIVLVSTLNPFFEELLESGYMLHALQGWGMWPAVLASAVLVGFLHAHLGRTGALLVFLTRVAMGLVYWRWRELWPLVVAHAALDLLGLLQARPRSEAVEAVLAS